MDNITNENFSEKVLNSKGVVVADFWAEWCGPCKMLLPIIGQVQDEIGDKASIVKVNVDECDQVAATYGVMTIPTLIFFKDGVEQERSVGVRTKAQIIQAIEKYL